MTGRKLTQGQKKLLRDWFNGLSANEKPKMWWTSDDLPYGLWAKLVEMHDTEVLHIEVARFVDDMTYDYNNKK